jgi:DNA-binding winged helix-turn-helix (wHTH) protein
MTVAATTKQAPHAPTTVSNPVSLVDERTVLSFPPFHLDLVEERLWNGTREVALRPKPFAILRYLAQHPRRLVTRCEIVEAVWGGRVALSDSLLRSHMHHLRNSIGGTVIETVVGRGYRFMATVSGGDDGGSAKHSGEGANPIAAPPVDWRQGRAFEILRAAAPGSGDPIVTLPVPSDAHDRILKELADAVATLGLSAALVLIVGDAQSLRLTTPSQALKQ